MKARNVNSFCVAGGPIRAEVAAGIALGTAILLIVGLVLLIRWHRRRGERRPMIPS